MSDSGSEKDETPAKGRSRAESVLDDEELNAEDSPLCLEYMDWVRMCCCWCCGIGKCSENAGCQTVFSRLTLAPLTVIAAVLGFVFGIILQSARPVQLHNTEILGFGGSGVGETVIDAEFKLSYVQSKGTIITEAPDMYDISDVASASMGSIMPLTGFEPTGCEVGDGEPCIREWEIVFVPTDPSDCETDDDYTYTFETIEDFQDCDFGKVQPVPGAQCPGEFTVDATIQLGVTCKTGFDTFIIFLKYPGDIFIRALKLMVLPLIIATMMTVPSRLGDAAGATRLGKRTIMYYVLTSIIGACEGLIWVNIFEPGKGVECSTCFLESSLSSTRKSVLDAFLDLGFSAVDKNLIGAYMNTNILGLVCFSFIFGYFVARHPHKKLMLDFIVVVLDVSMMIINILIKFTPLGMFSLVSGKVAEMKEIVGVLEALGMFVATATVALLLHIIIAYPLIYFLLTRKNPYPHYRAILPAPMTALATSSSAATMPVTLRVNKAAGVSNKVADFSIPLGTTVNMDGTAIGYPCAVIFLANLTGTPLTGGDQIVIAILATVISIGAAPVPSAGMVYLIVILEAVDIPVGGAVAFLFTVDWFVDRLETCVNVFGDSMGAAIIDFYERRDGGVIDKIDEEGEEGEGEGEEMNETKDDREDSVDV